VILFDEEGEKKEIMEGATGETIHRYVNELKPTKREDEWGGKSASRLLKQECKGCSISTQKRSVSLVWRPLRRVGGGESAESNPSWSIVGGGVKIAAVSIPYLC